MIVQAFKIKCLTNMHVGNGDANFNIIDNEVERDPVTKCPTINSSGVKGALREFFEVQKDSDKTKITEIFGHEKGESAGRIKILSANMIAVPMRASKGDKPFYMVTTKLAIDTYNELARKLLGDGGTIIDISPSGETTEVEGIKCDMTTGFSKLGIDKAAVMGDEDFIDVGLPVVARNKLENGKSANLWYEEIVPHESVFVFFAIANDADKELLREFAGKITASVIQFGGNATVGYGLCEVTLIGGSSNE